MEEEKTRAKTRKVKRDADQPHLIANPDHDLPCCSYVARSELKSIRRRHWRFEQHESEEEEEDADYVADDDDRFESATESSEATTAYYPTEQSLDWSNNSETGGDGEKESWRNAAACSTDPVARSASSFVEARVGKAAKGSALKRKMSDSDLGEGNEKKARHHEPEQQGDHSQFYWKFLEYFKSPKKAND